MAGENQSGMQCVECRSPSGRRPGRHAARLHAGGFRGASAILPRMRSMVEAAAGMHWLKGLDEAEPPRNLVHNILAQTIGALPRARARQRCSAARAGWRS